jgi:hypothetical protein
MERQRGRRGGTDDDVHATSPGVVRRTSRTVSRVIFEIRKRQLLLLRTTAPCLVSEPIVIVVFIVVVAVVAVVVVVVVVFVVFVVGL